MTQPAYETLEVTRDGHIATVFLNRPDKGNAMSPQLFADLGQAFADLDADEEVRAILLAGNGKAFTYGLDLFAAMADLGPMLQGGLAGPRSKLRRYILKLQRQIGMPATVRVPVVAAIHGWCIGGGVDLISACDIRFCSADAKFSVREARIGIVADIGSLQRLPKIIGDAATRELALTAKDIDAARALKLGLVSEVLPDRDALLQHATEETRRLAALPPLVVQGVKQVLNAQDGLTIEQSLDYVATWNAAFLQSEDFAEATAAFFEKREPVYKGA